MHGEHVVELDTVYHVGDLEAEQPQPSFSNEGSTLSVSQHPDVWRRIAAVHGSTYELTREDGRFYEADPTGPRDTVVSWCRNNGYVTETEAWRGVWYDPEVDDHRYSIHLSREDARRESQADVREDAYVEETTALTLDERGRRYWRRAFGKDVKDASPVEVEVLTPLWYAENELDVDGVWWPERLDPQNYSAPRGGIFQDRLTGWDVQVEAE